MSASASEAPWLPTERPTVCPYHPPEELARIREEEPLSRIRYAGDHLGWLVTSHSLAREVLADTRFSSRSELLRSPVPGVPVPDNPPSAPPGFMINFDPPEHTRYRRKLVGEFTVRRMRQLTERIEEITAECLDAMERQGSPVDLVRMFARPIPGLVISEPPRVR
ncbi:cytochrome P450 [Streptomyces noursei]|uniref:cytochrome P450 n=1 Tax=Streptomyces noursei TaxID=1971 RepID=UPI0016760C67|nr:cytochrome P450 [Streptomyces noursei]MCZ1013277.1 cytochrome P450 [Streptomyces noursei]